jgi:hypothetical protein
MTKREYPQFNRGAKVVDCFGKGHEVLSQCGCQVFFYDGDWAHPSRIWKR